MNLIDLVAQGRNAVYLVVTGGLILAILSSSFIGYTFVTRYMSAKPTWSLSMAFGLLIGFIYFTCRSFLTNFLHVPGILPFELFVMTLIMNRFFQKDKGHFISIYLSRTGLLCFMVLFASILIYGSWHYFTLVPVSSDPGAISHLIDILRDYGSFPYRISDKNPIVAYYPNGITFLAMVFLNPLIPTQSFPHIWPSLSFSLLVGSLTELVLLARKEQSDKVFLIKLLVCAALFRIFYPLDVSYIGPYLEGISKRTVFFPLALCIGFSIFLKRIRFSRDIDWKIVLLSMLGGLMPFLVNPSNWSVSAAAMVGGIVLITFQVKHKISVIQGLILFGVFCVVYFLQDPLALKYATFDSPLCSLLHDKLASCTDPLYATKIEMNGFRAHNVPGGDRWQDYLPVFLNEYSQFITIATLRPFFNSGSAWLWLALVSLGLIASIMERDWSSWRYGAFAGLLIVLLIVFYHFQVYAFYKVAAQQIKHLLKGYTEQSYFNIWAVFFCLFAVQAVISISIAIQTRRQHAISIYACLFLVLSIPAVAAWKSNKEGITWLQETTKPNFGSKSGFLAKIAVKIQKIVPPGSRVIVPGALLRINLEDWFFPSYNTFALAIIADYEMENSFSFFWDVRAEHFSQIHQNICQNPCASLDKLKVNYAIGFDDENFCGTSIMTWAQNNLACIQNLVSLEERRLPIFHIVEFKKRPL